MIKFYSGVDLIRQGWNRRGPNVLQEGYGTGTVLPEQGIYLAASVYRPVVQVWALISEESCTFSALPLNKFSVSLSAVYR